MTDDLVNTTCRRVRLSWAQAIAQHRDFYDFYIDQRITGFQSLQILAHRLLHARQPYIRTPDLPRLREIGNPVWYAGGQVYPWKGTE